jgi:hypothetical protein
MERITFEQALMAQRPRFAELFMERLQFDNEILDILKESGDFLQCKEIAEELDDEYTYQRIGASLSRLVDMGFVERVEFEQPPITVNIFAPKMVVIDGYCYYSTCSFDQEITVTPRIAKFRAF